MLLVGAFLAMGLAIGVGLGGSVRAFADVRIRLWWLAPVALGLQVAPISRAEEGFGELRPALALLLSFALLLLVAAANLRLPGFWLILAGVALNLAVIAPNRGMPVSGHALERLGDHEGIAALADASRGEKHHLAASDDVLRPLGDVIPVGDPFRVVVSPGDVAIYTGAGVLVAGATFVRARRRAPAPASPPAPTSTSS